MRSRSGCHSTIGGERDIRSTVSRDQQFAVAIAILLLRRIRCTIRRIFGEQFAVDAIDLPRLVAINFASRSLTVRVVGVFLPLIITTPCAGHLVLSVVLASTSAGVCVSDKVAGYVVTHHTWLSVRRCKPVLCGLNREQLVVDSRAPGLRHINGAIAVAVVDELLSKLLL